MTLALHGKSRQRQASLVLAAILALFAAVSAGIAAREAGVASANDDPYLVERFSVGDYAEPRGVLRHGELVRIDFELDLHLDPGPDGFTIAGHIEGPVQVNLFENALLAQDAYRYRAVSHRPARPFARSVPARRRTVRRRGHSSS
jgi:hypothetical protein